jgi:hypothetical protein
LVRSDNGGRTWDKRGLEGEAALHLIATGYETPVVYVYNAEPNARMKTTGIRVTSNDNFAWRRADTSGLAGKTSALAVHPSDARTLAVATTNSLSLSRDGGNHFDRMATTGQVLSDQFSLDGKYLWFASHDGRPHLYRLDPATQSRAEIGLPTLPNDAVAYIAQDPAAPSNCAIATFERDIYISADTGKTWRQIADHGPTRG